MKIAFFIAGVITSLSVFAKPLQLSDKELSTPPPRIIRTCCSFGSDVGVVAIPFIKVTDITSVDNLGNHKFLGSDDEGNGIIYTQRGGFIDIGHLRDQADWTAYLFSLISKNKKSGYVNRFLGHEGGEKKLHITIPANLSDIDAMELAGRIAYDLSIWHEIATWYGASYIPMVPERYSSFSVEDAYSNLLGIRIGIEALKSNLPYEQAMTMLINKKLKELKAVSSEADTYAAMEEVRNVWWTRDKHLPSANILLERKTDVYSNVIVPMQIPSSIKKNYTAYTLSVPVSTASGESLSDMYELKFRLNYKFPVKKIFPDEDGRTITQENFDTLIHHVDEESKIKELKTESHLKAEIREPGKEKRRRVRIKQKNLS